jgi:hypothetical protein
MKFIFENNRSQLEQRTFEAAVKSDWLVSDIFSTAACTSEYLNEGERLNWAPVLASLAYGEATAFYGFGSRIAEADDLSTKTWLVTHLQDEAKHSEGFTALLNYLYPSHRGRLESLMNNRNVKVFYGHTHACKSLVEWLICTQTAEVFGRYAYSALTKVTNGDAAATLFFDKIINDEHRHIAYIGQLIDKQRSRMDAAEWDQKIEPFSEIMIGHCAKMIDSKKAWRGVRLANGDEIEVTAFCLKAANDIRIRLGFGAR